MKIAQKGAFTLLSLMAVSGLVGEDADRYYSYTDFDDATRGITSPAEGAFEQATALMHHLFDPIERGFTEVRLFNMRDCIAQRVGNGDAFNKAFMDEVKIVLAKEMRISVINVVKQNKLVDVDVQGCVRALLQMVVDGIKEKHGIENVFEQDPHTLPKGAFTCYTTHYIEPILLKTGLPMATRDAALITAWAKSVYIALGYIQQFCENGRTALELFGVDQ